MYAVHLHTSLQEGWTALMKASSERHDDCVKISLNKGVNINQKNKVSAVSQSIIVCLACPLCGSGWCDQLCSCANTDYKCTD